MDYQNCVVLENKNLANGVFRLTLQGSWLCKAAKPGQFVMLGQGGETYLNRPFGIAGIHQKQESFSLLIKEVGEGTALLARVQPGQKLPVLGPLGNGFPLPQKSSKSLLIAGGMGIAPLLFLAQALQANQQEFAVLYGEKSRAQLLADQELQALTKHIYYTTEDGSKGQKGYPTVMLPELLGRGNFSTLYVCGPTPMMAAIARETRQYGVDCYVSLEERMGCGYGVCVGCVCKIKQKDEIKHLRVCKEGPVFLAEEVEWDG